MSATAIEKDLAGHSLDTGIPKAELRRICLRAGLEQLQRGELKARALNPDKRSLSILLNLEIHTALQKLASQTARSVDDLARDALGKLAYGVELTAADFRAMATFMEERN